MEIKNNEKDGADIFLAPGALLSPLPAVLVSCADESGKTDIVTVAWTGMLCTKPPLTYISLRPSRYSYGLIFASGCFVINLPDETMARKTDFCGIYTGKKVDKFARCGFEKGYFENFAAPYIKDCPLSLACVVEKPEGIAKNPTPLGTHDMFWARIVSVRAKSGLIDKNGRLMLDKAKLMSYSHGEYFAAGRKLGRFGFSTDKKKK